MADSPPSQPTACAACRADLSTVPFVLDKKGRGICKPCVAKLKGKQEAKAREAAQSPSEDVMGYLLAGSAASTKKPCPECQSYIDPESVVCVHCGYNIESGKHIKTRFIAAPKEKEGKTPKAKKSRRSIEIPPAAIYGTAGALYLVLGLMSGDHQVFLAIGILLASVLTLVSWIWAIISAFQDGEPLWGFVGMLAWLAGPAWLAFFFYVLFVNHRAHLKGLFVVNFVAMLAFIVLASQSGMLEETG